MASHLLMCLPSYSSLPLSRANKPETASLKVPTWGVCCARLMCTCHAGIWSIIFYFCNSIRFWLITHQISPQSKLIKCWYKICGISWLLKNGENLNYSPNFSKVKILWKYFFKERQAAMSTFVQTVSFTETATERGVHSFVTPVGT